MKEMDAWSAATVMSPGVNIGNTLDNTSRWETGWGNPLITKEYVAHLAALGFKTVRLPVAWDTYAYDGVIQPDKFERVREAIDWITEAGMFCVLNIHWDGGWIDSSFKDHYPTTYATFSPKAETRSSNDCSTRWAISVSATILQVLSASSGWSPKESASRVRWLNAVFDASRSRQMVPVLWDTGAELSRNSPYEPSVDTQQVLVHLSQPPVVPTPVAQ
jgi:hypothetical protein